ncbi:DUF1015 family protein [Kineococcus sp. SYSU DK003]|uniref:DUF1015 family protein n=1 Tax=Kineococcus sp. SYSU DK003 TaxID=3383124 RepID=UPI003D7CAD4A
MDSARTGARTPRHTCANTTSDEVLPAGPLLRPFAGLRYAPAVAGPLTGLLAPPHTELDKASRAAFLASSPFVVTHLERPEYSEGTGPEVHRWLDRGVLTQDPAGLYVVRQHRDGRVQHYLLGALPVVPGDSRVHPHEGVFDQAVAARLQRLDETGVDSEPVLVVDSDPWPVPWTRPEDLGALVSTARDSTGAPLVEVFHLSDPEVVDRVVVASATHRFVIADGHHRYAAVRRAARRSGHPEGLLVAVVDETVEPVDLQALHRVLPLTAAVAVVEQAPRTVDVVVDDHDDLQAVLAGLGAEQALVLLPGRAVVVDCPEPEGTTVGSGAWVDTVVRAGGTAADSVRYQADTRAVWAAVGARAAVLLPRPTMRDLHRVVGRGLTLGRKTTSFRPKPLAGAVMRLR